MQSDQKEFAKAETRVIANHNHSHALTMLYYEVLRHFKVTTEFVRVRNSLMVDYSALIVDFKEDDDIINHRLVLEQALLDSRLQECFASFDKLICATAEFDKTKKVWTKEKERIEKLPNPKDNIFHRYEIKILTGDDGTDGDPYVDLFSSDGQTIHLHQTSPTPEEDDTTILGTNNTGDFEKGETNIFLCNGSMSISWEKLKKIRLGLKDDSASAIEDSTWNVKRVTLKGYTAEIQESILFDSEVNATMEDEPDKYAEWAILLPPANPSIPPEPVIDSFIKDDLCCINKLKKHMVSNSQHYNRAIWLLEDPNDRASRFDGVTVNGKSLLDWIENRPLDVLGNYVVFPAHPEIGGQIEEPEKVKVEKLMTLPTRGVFGEAKLGHCNASEIIDNTRFWDWQASPIPEQAPEISPVSTDSRNVTQNLTPTTLPNSIVNIVNPSNLPDPTAMAGAMSLLGKSDIFRNMSMSAEVTDLLKKLSDNSVSFAEAANKARQIQGQQASGAAESTSASGASNTTGGNSQPQISNFSDKADALKSLTGYANPDALKSAASELVKSIGKETLPYQNAIASTNSSFVPATAPGTNPVAPLAPERMPPEIKAQLDMYLGSTYSSGSVPKIVATYLGNKMAKVWDGHGGIIGAMFNNNAAKLVSYLDNSVPNSFSSVTQKAKARAKENADNLADTARFEDGGNFYCIIRCRNTPDEAKNYMARIAHEICHYILASSEQAIIADESSYLFHADITDKKLGAKAREAFMNEVLGRRLNYLFHQVTDGDLISHAVVTAETLGVACYNFAAKDNFGSPVPGYYKPIFDLIRTTLTDDSKRRIQVGIWLQNFWTSEVLFDNATFDKQIKEDFNAAGHFLKTATDAQFSAVVSSGIQ